MKEFYLYLSECLDWVNDLSSQLSKHNNTKYELMTNTLCRQYLFDVIRVQITPRQLVSMGNKQRFFRQPLRHWEHNGTPRSLYLTLHVSRLLLTS